jgi:hypothetical protein
MSAPRTAATDQPAKAHTAKTGTVAAPVANQAAPDSKPSGALLALVRLLARQAATEAVRAKLPTTHDSGATQ